MSEDTSCGRGKDVNPFQKGQIIGIKQIKLEFRCHDDTEAFLLERRDRRGVELRHALRTPGRRAQDRAAGRGRVGHSEGRLGRTEQELVITTLMATTDTALLDQFARSAALAASSAPLSKPCQPARRKQGSTSVISSMVAAASANGRRLARSPRGGAIWLGSLSA